MSKKLELSINLRGRGWKYLLTSLLLLAAAFRPVDGNSPPGATPEEVGHCVVAADTE